MQLNPEEPFSTQISRLDGDDFEMIVAASLNYTGYHIDRNIIFGINRLEIAEIDIVASLITPLNEIKIAVECKGSVPSPNDLRKFSTVKEFLKADGCFVDLITFGSNSMRPEHDKVAEILGVKLLKKEDLNKFVLPVLWGTGELVGNRIREINRYLCVFQIENYYTKNILSTIDNPDVKRLLNRYRKYLYSDLWSIKNPVEQLNNCFEKAQDEFRYFTDTVATMRGTRAREEVSNPSDQIVQAAMYMELKHRLINLGIIARCSVLARSNQGREIISERTPAIRDALNILCDYNISPAKFLNFITRFIFIWGGILLKRDGNYNQELKLIAGEVGISDENAGQYIEILKLVYESGSSLFVDNNDFFFVKYVPAAYRALGVFHSRVSIPSFDGVVFPMQDRLNIGLLNNILGDGGADNLIF